MRKVAGFLFQEKKLKESAMVLKKLSSAKSMNPACDIPLIKVLLELNERQEALILLKKYLDAKNLGYYQIYAQNILAKLKAKS
jgi:predicted Zn-dependent protease